MAWFVPQNKLDPQQRQFVNNVDIDRGNKWIEGFAGSGKSVLLAHTAKKIITRHPDASMILIVFTRSLVEMFKAGFRDMNISVEVDTYYGFMDGGGSYDYILCDEVQDLPDRVLRAMKSRGEHVVVAGDSNQSIYEKDPRWQESTVSPSDINDLLDSSSFKLNIIHRLSRSIINALNKLMPSMNIFAAKVDMVKSDTQIRLCRASSEGEEVGYIMQNALRAVNAGYTVGVLLPSQNKIVDFANKALQANGKSTWSVSLGRYGKPNFAALNSHFRSQGLKMQYVGSGGGSFDDNDPKINIMTYYSAKGLDFDTVYIPFVRRGLFITPDENRARTVFMVAITRARENLYLTYSGDPCEYIRAFRSDCAQIDI